MRGADQNNLTLYLDENELYKINTFTDGDIKLYCRFEINGTADNVTLKFKDKIFYDHDLKTSSMFQNFFYLLRIFF